MSPTTTNPTIVSTTVTRPELPTPQPPTDTRPLTTTTAEDRFVESGAWVCGFAVAWIVNDRLLPWTGALPLVLTTVVAGLVVLSVVTAMTEPRPVVVDRVTGAVIHLAALTVAFALLSTLVFILIRGLEALPHLALLTQDMTGVGPRDDFSRGGILHAIAGSLIQVGIAIIVTIPLGIGTAIFMTEVGGRYAKVVRTVVEAMTALPSIVAGLFIYTTLIVGLGIARSGFAAAMALAVMMLPIIARASDVVLRVVPGGLREASLALGASRWRTVWHVVLPTARPGLATALILGVARGIGETSPVLLTSGAASFLVVDPTDGVMNSLPLFIYSTVRSGEPMYIARAFAAATVLMFMVLALFVVARRLARPRSTRPKRRVSR